MESDFQARLNAILRHPRNRGELPGADAVATVGNAACGEMLRLWVKFKETNGRRIIDRATFDGYGCETAIALASLATEQIRGKTVEQALAMSGTAFAGELGPLPPLKVHCAQLVESAVRDALRAESPEAEPGIPPPPTSAPAGENLRERFLRSCASGRGQRIVRLPDDEGGD